MPKKKSSGTGAPRTRPRKKKYSFSSNLIFYLSLFCLILFAGWLASLYGYTEKLFAQAQKMLLPLFKVKQEKNKPPAFKATGTTGQQILLEIQKSISRNQTIFNQAPVFSDCPVDEHYINCLQLTLRSDTDFILAEKYIRDLWERKGIKVDNQTGHNSPESLVLTASEGNKPLAQIIIQGGDAQKIQEALPSRHPSISSPKARVAIVIDDLGEDMDKALELAQIPGPITFSILPFQSRSQEVLELAKRYHKPVMLHMPMEPANEANPGKGALFCSMSSEEIISSLTQALDALPGVKGLNNHMGSAFTARREVMEPMLREINRRGLFFLDSRTSANSIGYQLAQELGVKSCERRVFLDNFQDSKMVSQKLKELCQIARTQGSAIGIGHPYPETIKVLEEKLAELTINGCELKPIQELCQ